MIGNEFKTEGEGMMMMIMMRMVMMMIDALFLSCKKSLGFKNRESNLIICLMSNPR